MSRCSRSEGSLGVAPLSKCCCHYFGQLTLSLSQPSDIIASRDGSYRMKQALRDMMRNSKGYQRNNLFHNKKLLPPWHLYDQVVSYLLEYEHANLPGFKPDSVNFRYNEQVQSSQHEGWRVNTDAGVSSTARKHSLGVVVTDEKDDIKAGLIIPIVGSVPPEVAEAKAILTAISWVQATKLPVNVLQTDCKSIVDKVYSTNCHNSIVNDIVTCIKNSLLFSPNLVIVHVPRELNKIAHACARAGLGLDNEYIWNGSLPSFVA
uniref:RNase H type-1 domain-containing protein n=1 Tax=Cannabis sativa TaxID=3483 RepID=A0A803PQB8_CANSA